ncbi:MAG: restriction endonuclease [Cyanobacteria bacterium P01_A01_bin.83]
MTIELTEYQTKDIPRNEINYQIIDRLKEKYSTQIKVNLNYSPQGDYWQLFSQGWVGYIPVTPDFGIRIKPKVPIKNLLGMLEYAYNLKSSFLDDLVDCDSLEEFYNYLAAILVKKILKLIRQGLSKTYIPQTKSLSYIRGRLDVTSTIKTWNPKLTCHYKQQTSDIPENQILLYTLYCISRDRICQPETKKLVSKAYHTLRQSVTLTPYNAKDCLTIKYNRLNQQYQQLHQLCRFFLDRTMPSYNSGNYQTLPFLINMARLYEKFVAQWLKINLPPQYKLKIKETIKVDPIKLEIDLLICDRMTGKTLYVLDTKYKNPKQPSNSDIYQIITYATSQNCPRAILIYPQPLEVAIDRDLGNNINLRTLIFSLEDNLEIAGQTFLQNL